MKKYFVLVSCFVALLVLVNVSFAQPAYVAPAVPCTCEVVAPAFPPFFYHPAPKAFADRFAVKRGKVPVTMVFPPQAFVGPALVAPPARPIATRRAARLAVQPLPPQFAPFPGVVAPPVVPDYSPAFISAPPTQAPIMGDLNRVHQRIGGAPTINFMSIVRAPRPHVDPYAAYYFQRGYPLPAFVPAE